MVDLRLTACMHRTVSDTATGTGTGTGMHPCIRPQALQQLDGEGTRRPATAALDRVSAQALALGAQLLASSATGMASALLQAQEVLRLASLLALVLGFLVSALRMVLALVDRTAMATDFRKALRTRMDPVMHQDQCRGPCLAASGLGLLVDHMPGQAHTQEATVRCQQQEEQVEQ